MIKRANNRGNIQLLQPIRITHRPMHLQELVKLMIYCETTIWKMRIIMVIMEEVLEKSDYPNVLSVMAQESTCGKVIQRNLLFFLFLRNSLT